jgi:hypothetical protein
MHRCSGLQGLRVESSKPAGATRSTYGLYAYTYDETLACTVSWQRLSSSGQVKVDNAL